MFYGALVRQKAFQAADNHVSWHPNCKQRRSALMCLMCRSSVMCADVHAMALDVEGGGGGGGGSAPALA